MLAQIRENTQFMQTIIQQQHSTIQKSQDKINKIQHSFSWQITGPMRAGSIITHGVGKLSSVALQGAKQAHAYIDERPKLKANLLQLTRLNKLYSKKQLT